MVCFCFFLFILTPESASSGMCLLIIALVDRIFDIA